MVMDEIMGVMQDRQTGLDRKYQWVCAYHSTQKSLFDLFLEHFTDQSMDDAFLLTMFELFNSKGLPFATDLDTLMYSLLDKLDGVVMNDSMVSRVFRVFRGGYKEEGLKHLGEELFSRLESTAEVEKAVRLLVVGVLSDDRHMMKHLGERMRNSSKSGFYRQVCSALVNLYTQHPHWMLTATAFRLFYLEVTRDHFCLDSALFLALFRV